MTAPDSPAPTDHRTEEMRELLGQQVRLIWVAWAEEQPNPKPSWLKPWHEMSEPDREVDRRIGERLYAQGHAAQWEVLAADLSKVMADRDRWLAAAWEYEATIGVLAPENDRVGGENERLRSMLAAAQRESATHKAAAVGLAAQVQRVADVCLDREERQHPTVAVRAVRTALGEAVEADQ